MDIVNGLYVENTLNKIKKRIMGTLCSFYFKTVTGVRMKTFPQRKLAMVTSVCFYLIGSWVF